MPDSRQQTMTSSGGRRRNSEIPLLTREERIRQFGFDCGADLVWRGWQPGGEYKKKLIVKNVAKKIQWFKYKLPATKFFSMPFPEVTKLTAGMNFAIEVSFRPIRLERYDDYIEVETNAGAFYIPVIALIPERSVTTADMIDFGFCPINETTTKNFQIINDGGLDVEFKWNSADPFEIIPSKGVVKSGEIIDAQVKFTPTDASVMVVATYVELEGLPVHPLKISGIGKYPYLTSNHTELEFGELHTELTMEKEFTLRNQSLVDATWELKVCEPDHDPVFHFNTTSGVIPPDGYKIIRVKYTPYVTGMFSSDHFDIVTPGGNTVRITCTGTALGPSVHFDVQSIDFGDVKMGKLSSRALFIRNESDIPAVYQFLVERDGVFQFDRISGTVPAGLSSHVNLKFRPHDTCNFYRRVFCLIKNQAPLYVDLLGTAYDDKRRPAPFTQQHVNRFQRRRKMGLSLMAPETMDEVMLGAEGLGLLEPPPPPPNPLESLMQSVSSKKKAGSRPGTVESVSTFQLSNVRKDPKTLAKHATLQGTRTLPPEAVNTLQTTFEETLNGEHLEIGSYEVLDEMFVRPSDKSQEVYVEEDVVEFGMCSRTRMSDYKNVTVHNNTGGKITCLWICPKDQNDQNLFQVFPPSGDVKPRSATTFKVGFRPYTDNCYFAQSLECFAYFKTMRNFRLVNDKSFTPPWCFTVRASGNTFSPNTEHFLPKLRCSKKRIHFPACQVGESEYHTIHLSNFGDTPIQFEMIGDPSRTFSCTPNGGVIYANEHILVCFKFNPRESKKYEYQMRCVLNHSPAHTIEFTLIGESFVPSLTFPDNNTVFFKPTCANTITTRRVHMKNPTRIPTFFSFEIPHKYTNEFKVEPSSGILNGNDTLPLLWTFSPRRANAKFNLQVPVKVASGIDHGTVPVAAWNQEMQLNIRAEALKGGLASDPEVLTMDTCLVRTTNVHTFALKNNTDSNIHYELVIRRLVDNEEEEAVDVNDSSIEEKKRKLINVNCPKGIVPARSNKPIEVTFIPYERAYHQFRVYVKVLATVAPVGPPKVNNMLTEGSILPPPRYETATPMTSKEIKPIVYKLSDIVGYAVFPTVSFSDVRSYGISEQRLWKNLCLPELNRELSSDLSQAEVKFNSNVEAILQKEVIYEHLDWFDFNFSAGVLKSAPTVVYVKFENSGMLPVDFCFKFPADLELEVERWADAKDRSEEDLRQSFVQEHKIFNVQPREGHLEPGESRLLTFTYSHNYLDVHDLPVILNISKGKQVVLNFCGRTIGSSDTYLELLEASHTFMPQPIGARFPPVQTFPIHNGGSCGVEYTLDLSPLEDLKSDNYNFDIFSCDNPNGFLLPGETAMVKWVFNPIEAKSYKVDIPLQVEDGKQTVVTFVGEGYHPTQQDPPPHDRIDFGDYPVHSLNHRMVMLHNRSETRAIQYQWEEENFYVNEVFDIYPPRGVIQPGEYALIKFTHKSPSYPMILDFDVVCVVMYYHEEEEESEEDLAVDDDDEKEKEQQMTAVSGRRSTSRLGTASSLGTSGKRIPVAERLTMAEKRRRGMDVEEEAAQDSHLNSTPSGLNLTSSLKKTNSARSVFSAQQGAQGDSLSRRGSTFGRQSAVTGGTGSLTQINTQTHLTQSNSLKRTNSLRSMISETKSYATFGGEHENPDDKTWTLYLHVSGRSWEVEEHRKLFRGGEENGNNPYFIPKSFRIAEEDDVQPIKVLSDLDIAWSGNATSAAGSKFGSRSDAQRGDEVHGLYKEVISEMFSEIVRDSGSDLFFHETNSGRIPYFYEFSSKPIRPYSMVTPLPSRPQSAGSHVSARASERGSKMSVRGLSQASVSPHDNAPPQPMPDKPAYGRRSVSKTEQRKTELEDSLPSSNYDRPQPSRTSHRSNSTASNREVAKRTASISSIRKSSAVDRPASVREDRAAYADDEGDEGCVDEEEVDMEALQEEEMARRLEESDKRRIMGSAEFEEIVEMVLEGTAFNLMAEAAFGEFNITTVPRQIVQNVKME